MDVDPSSNLSIVILLKRMVCTNRSVRNRRTRPRNRERGPDRDGGGRFHRCRQSGRNDALLDRSQLLVAGGAMLRDINFDRGPQTKVPGEEAVAALVKT